MYIGCSVDIDFQYNLSYLIVCRENQEFEVEEEDIEEEVEIIERKEDLLPCVFSSITPAWLVL
jgi:hypothetical protein